ncbi:MAG: hypothetical protein F6K10_32180 [Moorea sp. SIO2B7]|nr:hypothetical protein [Moorena sp. SIO2B7]
MFGFKSKQLETPKLIKPLNQIGRITRILEKDLHDYRLEFSATEWFGKASHSDYSFKVGERVKVLGLLDATTALLEPLTTNK